jgi:flavodoxin
VGDHTDTGFCLFGGTRSFRKKIAPFCTHGTGGLARTVEAVKKTCPDSKVLDALGISNSRVNEAESEVSEWLSHIGEK